MNQKKPPLDKTQIFALPGFLGVPQDWDPVFQAIQKTQPDWDLIAVDLRDPQIGPNLMLRDWGQEFNAWADAKGPAERRILVGYSMGGRLALHALLEGKSVWQNAIFLSTNPGMSTTDETEMRVKSDLHWAEKFKTENFSNVMNEWNQQPVFAGSSNEPVRKSQDYPKDFLALCLANWSLGRQDDFRDKIFKTKTPQMWIAGERDIKFARMMKEFEMERSSMHNHLLFEVIEDASHRLIFDQPELIARMIIEFASEA